MASLDQIHAIQKTFDEQDIVFCYSGYITEDVLLGMGGAIKKKLGMVQMDRKAARSVFAIFVEGAQNVIRYSQAVLQEEGGDDEDVLRHGLLAVGRTTEGEGEGDGYFVCCGNLVHRSDIDSLEQQLNHIKSLDADGLKAFYKETLRQEAPENSKGAGVGFIDIARRAQGGLEFGFKDVDDDYSYFYLKAYA